MRQKNMKTPPMFRIGLILVCLTLFSVYVTGGLYARYTTSSTGGDSARVAKFHIDSCLVSADVPVKLSFYDPALLTDEIELVITSASEVVTTYDVVVTMPDGVDYSWLDVKLTSSSGTVNAVADGNEFLFSDAGIFSFDGQNTHRYTLIFSIKEESRGLPPDGLTDISGTALITVCAEQVD